MYPQGEYPQGPESPVDPDDQQLFTQLYHGVPQDADDADERTRDAIVAANSGVAVSAAGGSAAAASVILAGQSAGVAGGAGAGGAAGASAGAATIVKGGVGLKFLAAGIAGVVVVSGVVVGVTVMNRDSVGNDAAPISKPAMDDGIEKFDFENTTFTDESGNAYEFTDGRYAPPEIPEDRGEGYHLTATEYADVDGDNDMDAATLIEWRPNAGAVTYVANLWLWDGDKAEQVEYPITTGYRGQVQNLKAVKGGFTVEMTEPSPVTVGGAESETSTVTIGFKDGYPVQTDPLGSVDRCSEFPGSPAAGPYEDVVPKVAPSDDAPDVGKADDIKAVYVVTTERSTSFQGEWMAARVEHADGSTGCGWVPADTVAG